MLGKLRLSYYYYYYLCNTYIIIVLMYNTTIIFYTSAVRAVAWNLTSTLNKKIPYF